MEDHSPRKGDHFRNSRPFLEGFFMNRWAARILEWINTRELFKFVLLAVFLGTAVLGIAPLIFRSDRSLFLSAVLFGLSAGWITGRIPLPPAAAGLVDAALGIDFLLLVIGRLDVPLRGWIGSFARWLLHLLPQYADAVFDAGSFWADAYRILQGSISVIVRFQGWGVSVVRGEGFFDPVASALLWSLLLFLTGAFAGWAISARKQPFAAALPAVLLLAAVFSYVHGDWHYAILTVGLVFLLVVITEHSQKEQEWDRRDMGYSTSIRWDLFFSAVPALAVILIAASIIPSTSIDEIRLWVREQNQPRPALGNSVGQSFGLNPEGSGRSGRAEDTVLPGSHYLGRGPDLTRDVALVVVTGERLNYLPGIHEPVPPRHYWKALAYDYYTGSGWLTSPTEERELQAGGRLLEILPKGILLHQIVTVSSSGFAPVYFTGELAVVYQLSRVVSRTEGDILGVIASGTKFEVDSVVLEVDESILRAAGMDYPGWIRTRYLQLPDGLPERVHALARDLTATPLTPYDRAIAIQDYLRNEMHYSLKVGVPPYDRDVVDYFLFDSKEGFCDYYATAMAVLARSAGIPARIAFGYASGSFDPAQGKYTVLESDAHAWPELYFPGVGWVEFEPTSVMAEIRRSPASESVLTNPVLPPQIRGQDSAVWRLIFQIIRQGAIPLLIALLSIPALLLGWSLLAPVRLMALAPAQLMRSVYRGLRAHGTRQGIRFSSATTPAECTRQLAQRNPAYAVPLEWMTDLYSRQVYGGKKISPEQHKEVIRIWPGLDRGLWWAWWNSRLRLLRRMWLRPRRGR
jgi:hypothetical protein